MKWICTVVEICEPISNRMYQVAKRIETHHPKYELITIQVANKIGVTPFSEREMPPQVAMAIAGRKDDKTQC